MEPFVRQNSKLGPERPWLFLYDAPGRLVSWPCDLRARLTFWLGLPSLLDWVHYLIDEDRVRAIYVAVPLDSALAAFRHSLAALLTARAADVAFVVEASFRLPDRARGLWQGGACSGRR